MDVRSPGEFAKGHWPGAINVPLFDDEERAAVGTAYKQQGRTPAIHMGLELTGPKLSSLARQLDKPSRTRGIHGSTAGGAECVRPAWPGWPSRSISGRGSFRGGTRAIGAGPRACFEQIWPLRVMGGRTGTGKTDLLLAMAARGAAVVDLEGLANHRGSSFGGLGLPDQPSTEHYENQLAEALDQHQRRGATAIWLEAESIQVGRCRIPKALFDQMQEAPVLEIQRDLGERVNQLVQVYGHQGGAALAEATERISRRLGPQRTKEALEAIAREDWATACRATLDYYDRCYDHELARSPKRDTIDLSGLSADQAAETLIDGGFVEIPD